MRLLGRLALLLVILAPVFEEYLFRGFIVDGLLKKYSASKSIIIPALIFAILHPGFIYSFLGGLFWGWIYYRSKNIILCIATHSFANLLAFLARLNILSEKEIVSQWGMSENLFINIAILLVLTGGLFLCVKIISLKTGPLDTLKHQ